MCVGATTNGGANGASPTILRICRKNTKLSAADDLSTPTKETTVIDESNGYAAYMDSPNGGNSDQYAVIETALFKTQTETPLLVVSNLIDADDCSNYETFFLRRVGRRWTEVKCKGSSAA